MYDNNKYFKTGIYAYLNSTASPQNSGWLRDPKIQPSIDVVFRQIEIVLTVIE